MRLLFLSLLLIVGFNMPNFHMGLSNIFNTQPAIEERQVLGISKEEQGDPEAAMKDAHYFPIAHHHLYL